MSKPTLRALALSAIEIGGRAPIIGALYRAVVRVCQRVVNADAFVFRSDDKPKESLQSIAEKASLVSLTVRHGPFKGMRYSRALSAGSSLYPKLFGSYEAELHPTIERAINTRYTSIVDIGCAEGYYAVGFALKKRGIPIYAFDTSDVARELCLNNARENGVEGQVHIAGACSPSTLSGLRLGSRSFIISDCEGYEKDLFVEEVVREMSQHDLLIELHDFIDISIRETLVERFKATHRYYLIESVDDLLRGDHFAFAELQHLDRLQKKMLLAENRPGTMQWLILYSNQHVTE